MSKQEDIVRVLKPYFENPSICGIQTFYNEEDDIDEQKCCYLTSDGKKCVAGQFMKEGEWQQASEGIDWLINEYGKEIFIEGTPELTGKEWQSLQCIHDSLALGDFSRLQSSLKEMEKFASVDLSELKKLIVETET